jgi:hypothetical protein
MDGLLDVILYKQVLDAMRNEKDTLPEEAQFGFMIFEQALMDAISYQKNKFTINNLIKELYKQTTFVVINGERYYSINKIKNVLKELEGDEEKAQESITFDAETDIDSIKSIINDLLYGGDDEEDKGSEE